MTNLNSSSNGLLRLNVGFLLKESAGYSREITFNHPETIKANGFTLNGLDGSLRMTRTPQGILVQGSLLAQTSVECVRCLTPFNMLYEVEISELFALAGHVQASEEDTPYTIDEGNFIDLAPIVREEGILAIPMQVLCALDCKGLCPHCGQDLNAGTCDCEVDDIDPRWAELRAHLEDM